MFDTQNNAQNVILGSGIQFFNGSVSNYDGSDYFKLQVDAPNSTLSLSLFGLSADANLSLLDSAGKLLSSSINTGSTSEAINTTLGAGTYFVKVDRLFSPAATNTPYQLAIANNSLFSNIDDKNPNGQMFYTGDFNGDGIQDVFRQERGNWIDGVKDAEFLLGKANGNFDAPIQVANSGLFQGNNNRLIFGDFNGDRKTDIIRQEINGWIDGINDTQFVQFVNGNFQVVGNLQEMNAFRGDLNNIIAGDFNGDGIDDLVDQEKGSLVNGDRDAVLYISDGRFGWASKTVLPNSYAVNGNDTQLVAGDFIAGGGKDLIRIETTKGLIDGNNDIQYLSYKDGSLAVVSNTPTINVASAPLVTGQFRGEYFNNQ